MKRGWLVGIGIVLLLVGVLVVVAVVFGSSTLRGICPWCGGSTSEPGVVTPRGPMGGGTTGTFGDYDSNGERIFFTGVGHAGIISRSVSYGPGMMGGTGCATCHGSDGRGGTFAMMGRTIEAPDITFDALTSPHTGEEHEEEAWTLREIETAIRDGVEPSGDDLDPIMPRWEMDDQDMADLVRYLKELSR